ncbi:helix-turn-helix domain-containing protein [Actinomadura rudentiformis]|uniref:helix-turn-helix domain-containing protein n=1 Tax=Actinomadura rudentiformis TaxID=359158 RepID=UPI00178C69FE|nr:helix-turn-helix domain-containing protein [Actinomadura rudentiformis]
MFEIDTLRLERLACWQEMLSETEFPVELRNDSDEDFHATYRHMELGAVRISELISSGIRVTRTERLIRQWNPEVYQLCLVRAGSVWHTQCGRHVEVGPGRLFLRTSSHPFESRAAPGLAISVRVQFPRSALPSAVDSLVGVPISAGEATGALLSRYLNVVMRHAGECTAPERATISRVLLDLIAALCTREVGAPESPLVTKIHGFIEQHLDDPRLTPQSIADAHQISLRHLHKLFQDQGGHTVTAWIRRRRLERCRQDLADPALSGRPIHAIASRWGFTERAHFSKLFRATYGMPPGQYRHDVWDARTDTQSAQRNTDRIPDPAR